jgi:hypothetical protein
MRTLDRRLAALEEANPDTERLFLFVVSHGEEVTSVRESAHLPAMHREDNESENDFKQRVNRIADERLPSGWPAVFFPV